MPPVGQSWKASEATPGRVSWRWGEVAGYPIVSIYYFPSELTSVRCS